MKKFGLLATLILSSVALIGCSEKEKDTSPLVEIGEMVITKGEFYQALKTSVGEDVLKQLTLERLLEERYEVSAEEIQEEIDAIKREQGFTSNKELGKALQENGVTLDDLKGNMKKKLLLDKASMDAVDIPESAIKEEYERVKNQVRVSHILVKEKSVAKDLVEQLRAGADFETLAKQHSIDTASSLLGGDLGFIGQDYVIDALEKEAFSLPVGEISEPLETPYGIHILKVTEKNRSYDELKETLELILMSQQKKTADEVLTDLIKNHEVSIYDPSLKNALK